MAIIGAVLLQVAAGGFVAGLDAGFGYNTWPLMDGALVPSDLLIQHPLWVNFFENAKTVQFVHRIGAYTVFLVALYHMVTSLSAAPKSAHAQRSVQLFWLIAAQATLGVVTLLHHVPLHAGLAHQGLALIVLGFAVAHLRGFYGAYKLESLSGSN